MDTTSDKQPYSGLTTFVSPLDPLQLKNLNLNSKFAVYLFYLIDVV